VSSGPQRVAVIGSGVSGLTAAYVLQRRYEVYLIEADQRLGGHAHTHDVVTPDAGVVPVDSGFIVHNRVTYPNLLRLFDELGVETQPSDMSMSVRCEGCGLEYAGARGPKGVFPSRRNLTDWRFVAMLLEVDRFHRRARRLLARGGEAAGSQTLGEFLSEGRFSRYFTSHFMVPVVSAVWSSAPEVALVYPARYLFEFLANHGLLSVSGSHRWYTLRGGSRSYVSKVAKGLTSVRTSAPARAVLRADDGVEVRFDDGACERYDKAVIATHPDTALSLLGDAATAAERQVLGAFRYSRNLTLLHHDDSVLPRHDSARASWNYLLPSCDARSDKVVVSYDMNRLQSLPTKRPVVVTLNATDRVAEELVVARMLYEHPIYTPESVAAQRRLSELNDHTLAFAGAYHGWGFHEDGARAGVAAAAALGVRW